MRYRLLALTVIALAYAAPAVAQDDWNALVARAKGQTLVINNQPDDAINVILDVFSKKFGISVQPTAERPSQGFARIATEQKNGQFGWDVWWGGSSNMSLNAAPAGMLEPLDKILILPEVTNAANWRSADFIYGDSGRHVFTYMNYIDFGMLRNTSVLPDLKIDTLDALLDPRLKGKISIRDASEPNFSNDMLATIVKQKGGDFLKRVLTEQQPKIYSNQQLLLTDITRGGQALSIGLDGIIWERCKADGGCANAMPIQKFGIALSWGVSVPKNPPHPDAAKVFVNWFLSKDGQEEFVRDWPKYNDAGAVSMRKDVVPSPEGAHRLPDFSNPDQYAFIATDKGAGEVATALRVFKEATGH